MPQLRPSMPRVLICVLGIQAIVLGCSSDSTIDLNSQMEEAKDVVGKYLENLGKGDIEAAMNYCSPIMFAKTDKESWKLSLAEIKAECGQYRGVVITEANAISETPSNDSDVIVLVNCRVSYSIKKTNETLTLHRLGGKPFKIIGHTVKADPSQLPPRDTTTASIQVDENSHDRNRMAR